MQNELQRVVDTLAERLGRSVAIDDPAVRLIYASRHFGDEDPVRVRAVLQRSAGSAAIAHVLSQGVTWWTEPGIIPPRDDLGMRPRLCVPIRWRGTLLGLLMVIQSGGTVTEEQLESIKTVSHHLAALLFRDTLLADEQRATSEGALRELFSAREAQRQAGVRFFEDNRRLGGARQVTVTVVDVLDVPPDVEATPVEVALRTVLDSVTRGPAGAEASLTEDRRGILLQARNTPTTIERSRQEAAQIIQEIRNLLGTATHCTVGIGADDVLENAWISHEQAIIAARAARLLPDLHGIAHWSELGAYGMLLRIPPDQLTPTVLPSPLRTLIERDSYGRLWETLTAYLDHAGSSPATAAALHIHRTSLYYRLHQIEEITGLDLANGEDRLILHLGTKVAALLQQQRQ